MHKLGLKAKALEPRHRWIWHPTNTHAWRAQTTAPKTKPMDPMKNHCLLEKIVAATNGALVTRWDHSCPPAP